MQDRRAQFLLSTPQVTHTIQGTPPLAVDPAVWKFVHLYLVYINTEEKGGECPWSSFPGNFATLRWRLRGSMILLH